MPFTYSDAREKVGNSIDWTVGKEASIRKWEQIVSGDKDSYPRGASCGLCMVTENRGVSCKSCPATLVCGCGYISSNLDAGAVLQMLQEIDLEEKQDAG